MAKSARIGEDQAPLFDNQLLTYEEAAERLKLGRRTLERLVSRERIPYRRVGRNVRFYWPQLVDWLSPKQRRTKR